VTYTPHHAAPRAQRTIGRKVVAGAAALAVILAPTAAYAESHTVQPRKGEGLISLTKRTCGSAKGWKDVAADNNIRGPVYLVRLGRAVKVECGKRPEVRRDTRASRSTARSSTGWVRPVAGGRMSSCWGAGRNHAGIDIAVGYGTPIRAVTAGKVHTAGWVGGYGYAVILSHGGGVYTLYGHASKLNVGRGQKVAAGKVIARVGSTGDSTGNHVHVEVHKGLWHRVNPAPFLRARGVKVGC
jgi:murein DD-endopeptidase MepM/ murein hydrolase activator NlpD